MSPEVPRYISPCEADEIIKEALRPFIGKRITEATKADMFAAVAEAAEGVLVVYPPKPYSAPYRT